jgi:quinol monooxygenase YgiN
MRCGWRSSGLDQGSIRTGPPCVPLQRLVRRGYHREMDIGRRDFIRLAGVAAVATIGAPGWAVSQGAQEMYGLIGKMTAVPGQRDALISILLEGVAEMPGCHSYIVAKDPADANAIWITEVWDSKASHEASLALPSVRQAIARGKPLIAAFGEGVVTTPVGGHGLASAL